LNVVFLLNDSVCPGADLRQLAANSPAELPSQVRDLIGVKQSPESHPEGCAFLHTTHVLDAMARICRERNIVGPRRWALMVSALCHDFGKAATTQWNEQKGKWTSYGHAEVGVELTRVFMEEHLRGCQPYRVQDGILSLVRWHMTRVMKEEEFTPRMARKLVKNLAPASYDDLLLLMEADTYGRPPLPGGLPPHISKLTDLIRDIEAKATLGV